MITGIKKVWNKLLKTDRLIVKQCGFGEANYNHNLNIMSESGASSFKDQHVKHSKTIFISKGFV